MEYTFREKLKTILILIKEPKVLSKLLSLRLSGYLMDVGWFSAFKIGEPVDKNFEPLPWLTYSFIDFITERLSKKLNVFEFGSGNSTLFFAKKVNEATSVEHNIEWYNKLKSKIPNNSKIILSLSDSSEDYIAVLKQSNKKYDIIIIDGIHRVDCCLSASNYLTDNGVIILDDSEKEQYSDGIKHLLKEGFKKIDFWGIPPGIVLRKCTTIFYKTKNCMDI
ncbi:MAG: FkbM family methyltransferase [Bacteroidetes bacterium]|nr:FkbM family methyltransferase [Bacteroidota bacterium]